MIGTIQIEYIKTIFLDMLGQPDETNEFGIDILCLRLHWDKYKYSISWRNLGLYDNTPHLRIESAVELKLSGWPNVRSSMVIAEVKIFDSDYSDDKIVRDKVKRLILDTIETK
jgi:hypothetical protein